MTTTDRSGPEPTGDPEYARQLGARLRAIREQRRWSLRDVQLASHGRFTGSAVGTYERGERGVSVQRLSELAQLYGVPVARVLPDVPWREGEPDQRRSDGDTASGPGDQQPPEKVIIDLVALERRSEPELETIRHYIDAIKLKRGDFNGRMLSVRSADVWAWAAMSALDTEGFVQTLDRLDVLRHA
jgi:transcriptional regulator with XRE-family HTH domain